MSNIPVAPGIADILNSIMRRLDALESTVSKKK